MKHLICAGLIAVGLAVLPVTASAAPVTWTVNTDHNGAPLTGQFTIDIDTRTVANVQVSHAGTVYTAGLLVSLNDKTVIFYLPKPGNDQTDQPGGRIGLIDPLTNAGGVANVQVTEIGKCDGAGCLSLYNFSDDFSPGQTIVGVPVPASIPTLSEWALIALGLMLSGGAAAYVQRRHRGGHRLAA